MVALSFSEEGKTTALRVAFASVQFGLYFASATAKLHDRFERFKYSVLPHCSDSSSHRAGKPATVSADSDQVTNMHANPLVRAITNYLHQITTVLDSNVDLHPEPVSPAMQLRLFQSPGVDLSLLLLSASLAAPTYRTKCAPPLPRSAPVDQAQEALEKLSTTRPTVRLFQQKQVLTPPPPAASLPSVLEQEPSSTSAADTAPPAHPAPLAASSLAQWILNGPIQFIARDAVDPKFMRMGPTKRGVDESPQHSLWPDYQFDVLHQPVTVPMPSEGAPVQDPVFARLCAEHGSKILFHGSPTRNWHSIVHNGLEVRSFTDTQAHGSLYGAGVYMTDVVGVSRQFSSLAGVGAWGQRSKIGAELEVVGVYEVALSPEGVTVTQQADEAKGRGAQPSSSGAAADMPDSYYVISHKRYVRLRSLLVWKVGGTTLAHRERASNAMVFVYVALLVLVIAMQMDFDSLSLWMGRRLKSLLRS